MNLATDFLLDTFELEEHLVHLEHPNEQRWDVVVDLEMNKHHVKDQYDKSIGPCSYSEGDFVLLYDQYSEPLGAGKFNPMWHGPYMVKHVLEKGAYELEDYEGNSLAEPRNGLYIKKDYA